MKGWRAPSAGIVCLSCILIGGSVFALQRKLGSKSLNYPGSPVVITRSDVTLITPSSDPVKVVVSDAKKRKSDEVYYLTRDEPGYLLKGKVVCRNTSLQTVEAIQLAVVLLDAFHNPAKKIFQLELSSTQRLSTLLPIRSERELGWEQAVSSGEISEVAVVVVQAQFANSTVWTAPREELVDIF